MRESTVKIAAIQMDASPAPAPERLERAGRLVAEAAEDGAQLVVLPELFNYGYAYSDENYRRAEGIDGPTATWLRETATRLGIHLAGTFMLLDQDEIYNALLLFAPDGRCWRYDKNYPWGWERAYFRDSHRIAVAHTDLGDIGLMICWDSAHADLWRRYAGQVDLMLICSCPPDVTNPTYHFPDGDTVTIDEMGPAFAMLKGSASKVFKDTLHQQTAWLGVPAVNTVGCGHIRTGIPNGRASLFSMMLTAPWLLRYLPEADGVQMSCDFVQGCKIVDARGQVMAELAQENGEAFTLAEVSLAPEKPAPQGPQPRPPVHRLAYLVSDALLPWLSAPVYRQGLQQAWGQRMAPTQAATRQWTILLGIGIVTAFWLGILLGRRK